MEKKVVGKQKVSTTRPPVDENSKIWVFAGLIRNLEYFERAVTMIREEHFALHERWLCLVWSIVAAYHSKYQELPTKNMICTQCSTAIALDPTALTDADIDKLNEFLGTAFDMKKKDWPERHLMAVLQQFLEDRLLLNTLESLSRPSTPLSLGNVFSEVTEKAKSISSLTGGAQILDNLAIACGVPEKNGQQLVTARLGDKSHKHHFKVLDQYQREKFCEKLVDKFKLNPHDIGELEKRVLAAADAETGGHFTPNVICLEDVEAKLVDWFWRTYIPAGAITILDGDPGDAKSTLALDLAARYSRGDAMPPYPPGTGEHYPGNTLVISCEDDLERTIKPRLLAAGGCVKRIHALQAVKTCDGDDERHVQLPLDIRLIEKILVEKQIGFLVIDVLSSVTQEGTSMNEDGDMRRLMTPLTAMAQRTQVTVLVIRHLNKKQGLNAMYRGTGSIAITAAARSVLAVAPHPSEPGRKVLVGVKHNLGPRPASLTYEIEPVGNSLRLVWGEPVELTAADVLGASGKGPKKLDQAKAIVAEMLAAGPCSPKVVQLACKQAGIGEKTCKNAREELGVKSQKVGGYGSKGQWMLSLNGDCDANQNRS